jgi:phospholipid/cholesterol/gamma-HCH transport system substrate-binding protein
MSRLERLYAPPEIGAPGKRAAAGRRRDLLLAGLFVAVMAAVAVWALALLIPGFFGGAYRLNAYFADASGLKPGTQVIQDGFLIGMVDSMSPVFPGRDPEEGRNCPGGDPQEAAAPRGRLPCFRATLRIRHDWPIPRDSRARLGSAGLLQGEAIAILPGTAEDTLADGDRISAADREIDLMDQLGALTDSLQSLVDETIAPALASIRQQIKTIEDLLGTGPDTGENRDRLAGVFENLQQLSEGITQAVRPEQLEAIMTAVQRLSENLAQVSGTLGERTGEIERTVRNYGDLAVDLRGLVRENRPSIERSLDDTQYLLQELAAALTPILTNIEDATRDLSALARDLRANPAVIIRGREVEDDTPWFR